MTITPARVARRSSLADSVDVLFFERLLLFMNCLSLANGLFRFSSVRSGSICSLSESAESRIPTTRRSRIFSSLSGPYSQLSARL